MCLAVTTTKRDRRGTGHSSNSGERESSGVSCPCHGNHLNSMNIFNPYGFVQTFCSKACITYFKLSCNDRRAFWIMVRWLFSKDMGVNVDKHSGCLIVARFGIPNLKNGTF